MVQNATDNIYTSATDIPATKQKHQNQIIIKADQNKLGKGGLKHQVVSKSNEILNKSSQYKQYALQKTSVF